MNNKLVGVFSLIAFANAVSLILHKELVEGQQLSGDFDLLTLNMGAEAIADYVNPTTKVVLAQIGDEDEDEEDDVDGGEEEQSANNSGEGDASIEPEG